MTAAQHQILHALFCLSRDTRRISATTLAERAGMTATLAAATLVELEHAGLVDASRARLTMIGLATAVRLGPAATGGGTRRAKLEIAAAPRVPETAPLAARSTDVAAVYLGEQPAELA